MTLFKSTGVLRAASPKKSKFITEPKGQVNAVEKSRGEKSTVEESAVDRHRCILKETF